MTEIKLEYDDELLACRICLATDTKLFGIRDHCLEETFVGIMGTTLSEWDGLPQHLCSCCRALLRKSAGLRARCHRAQELLKQSLIHQHYLTTDFLRTIDRISHQLSLHLTTDKLDPPIEITYDEEQKNYLNFSDNDTAQDDLLNEVDPKDSDDSDDEFLVKSSTIQPKLNPPEKEIDIQQPKEVLRKRKVVKDIKTVRKVKKVPKAVKEQKKENVEDTEEKKKYKRKKKGFKRFFSCEEDYIKFENNYNISIIKVSEEEQRKDMAARKLSANYARAHVRCDKCYKGFLSEATFENHQKVHDPIMGANECHLCFARFKHPTRLRRHMETHTLKFVCKLCPLVTRHRGMAMMHSDFHSGKTFECKYCGLTFKKKTTFNTHIRVQHPLENASGGTCDVCGETFIGKRGLQQHKTMAHRKLPIPELKCSSCGVQFDSLDAIVRHADAGCQPDLRACAQCGEAFPSDEQLAAHQQGAHVEQVYQCDDCDKSFATKSSLGTHVDRVHLKIKPKKTGFYKYHMYPKKMQVKRVEEICEICGKGYPSSTWLKYHQRTHTGERPYKCPDCPKSYMTPAALQSSTWLKYHQRTHTGERPYKCPDCPKSYMTPAALQSHSVSHSGVRRWQCAQCPKTFLHQSSIYKHKLVHTGEKPFSCHICSKSFTQSGSLATHVKYVHMKLKPPPRRRRHPPA